jgi:hypothetical protein
MTTPQEQRGTYFYNIIGVHNGTPLAVNLRGLLDPNGRRVVIRIVTF